MNNYSLVVTIIFFDVLGHKCPLIRRAIYRHDRGPERVPALVVKHSDKMAAPLRQRDRSLRGRVADDENRNLARSRLRLAAEPSSQQL
jgi:hypothetical protein